MAVGFFKLFGVIIRWIFEYKCTFNKEKLKELTDDEKGKNLWYSIFGYIAIILVFFVLQHFKMI